MNNKKKRMNNKFYILFYGLLLFTLLFILLNSYAYWYYNNIQENANIVATDCLSIELKETESIGFTTDHARPVTDEQGIESAGYTFSIENKCQKSLFYQVVLDSIEIPHPGKEFDTKFIKLQFDNGPIKQYYYLEDAFTDGADSNLLASKIVYKGLINASSFDTHNEVEHNIKLWISKDAPNEMIGKEFNSKIRVMIGDGIDWVTDEMCFDFDASSGTITGFREDLCDNDNLIVPSSISGVEVKNIFQNCEDSGNIKSYCNINWGYIDFTKDKYLTSIENYAFNKYTGLGNDLIIPNSVTNIGAYAFYQYKGPYLKLGASVTNIGNFAFSGYIGSKQSLIIPDSVTNIENNAFMRYNGPHLKLGSNVKTISNNAFRSYQGDDSDLIIPNSVTNIGAYAFHQYKGPYLKLGSNVTTIGDVAFYNYVGTKKDLIIPDSVTTIGNLAFFRFQGNSLTLGSNLTRIGSAAFQLYRGTININMTEEQFNRVSKGSGWKNAQATLNFLK